MIAYEPVSLDTIDKGSLLEQFNVALGKVLANIKDLSCSDKDREITIKLVFRPNERRDQVATGYEVKSKLADLKPRVVNTAIDTGSDGQLKLFEAISRQREIDFDNEKVTQFGRREVATDD